MLKFMANNSIITIFFNIMSQFMILWTGKKVMLAEQTSAPGMYSLYLGTLHYFFTLSSLHIIIQVLKNRAHFASSPSLSNKATLSTFILGNSNGGSRSCWQILHTFLLLNMPQTLPFPPT